MQYTTYINQQIRNKIKCMIRVMREDRDIEKDDNIYGHKQL